MQDSADTDGTIQPAALSTEAEKPSRSRVGAVVALLALVAVAGVAFFVSRPEPAIVEPAPTKTAEPPPVEPVTVETAPVVEPAVPPPAPVATAPVTAPTKAIEKRPVKIETPAPPPETVAVPEAAPVIVPSALFVVDRADDLLVTCGTRSSPGTTIAKPTKFPAGPCTVRAQVDGATLTTTVDVREKARFVCEPSEGALACRPG